MNLIMFLTDEEAKSRISSLDNLVNKLELRKVHNGGRPKGRKNDTQESRLAVAEDAIVLGPTKAAEIHNTTISRASLLSDGVVTHGLSSDEELAPAVQNKKEQVHEKALDIVMSSLGLLENQIGKVFKAKDLASIAANMARIAEKTGGRLSNNPEDNKPKVQVVVYAPRMRGEEEFEVIDIN